MLLPGPRERRRASSATTSPSGPSRASSRTEPYDPASLRQALEDAVHRQLMCDVPYGLLISGGVDSSVVAAIAARYREKRVEEDDQCPAWWPQIHSFAVGLKGAPGPGPGPQGGRLHRRHPPRDPLHRPGGPGRPVGRDLPPGELRHHHGAGLHAHVSADAQDPRHGHQDGAVRRGGRRDLRRLPLFPQGPRRPRSCTTRPCASSRSCTSTTACAPTRAAPPGAWRPGCRSWTGSSWTWP